MVFMVRKWKRKSERAAAAMAATQKDLNNPNDYTSLAEYMEYSRDGAELFTLHLIKEFSGFGFFCCLWNKNRENQKHVKTNHKDEKRKENFFWWWILFLVFGFFFFLGSIFFKVMFVFNWEQNLKAFKILKLNKKIEL